MGGSHPTQIELFAKKPDYFNEKESDLLHITPIETGDGISNFSAILLDEELYAFIKQSRISVNNISTINFHCLLGLKSIAWHANQQLRDDGIEIKEIDIIKHPDDMLRIVSVLDDAAIIFPAEIYESLQISKEKLAGNDIRQRLLFSDQTGFATAIAYIEEFVKKA